MDRFSKRLLALIVTALVGCGGMVADVPAAAPERPPIVVMGHGFGGTRDVGLPYFAEQLAARGMAVLLFDYRTFGASGGGPRQLVDPWRQLEDWRAALAFARSQPNLDGERAALFGSSLGAGHAVITAADDGGCARSWPRLRSSTAASKARLLPGRGVGRSHPLHRVGGPAGFHGGAPGHAPVDRGVGRLRDDRRRRCLCGLRKAGGRRLDLSERGARAPRSSPSTRTTRPIAPATFAPRCC